MEHPRIAGPQGPNWCAHQHLVEFYESDAFLVDTVADFAVPALRDWDSVVIVATAAHRVAFADAISAHGIDLKAAGREGRYQALDAWEMLSMFMERGVPDPARLKDVAGVALDRAAVDGRHVKVYGEMVALLMAEGNVTATLALEELWCDLANDRDFSLMCAYPLKAFDTGGRDAFRRICSLHSTVIPTEKYSLATTADEQQRIVAELQQEAAALRAELHRRRRQTAQAAGSVLLRAG
jgi:hypothetical protein